MYDKEYLFTNYTRLNDVAPSKHTWQCGGTCPLQTHGSAGGISSKQTTSSNLSTLNTVPTKVFNNTALAQMKRINYVMRIYDRSTEFAFRTGFTNNAKGEGLSVRALIGGR
jgi:hypothetical protein